MKNQSDSQTSLFKSRIPIFITVVFFIFWIYIVLTNYYKRNPVYSGVFENFLSVSSTNTNLDTIIKVWVNHFLSILIVLLIFFSAYSIGQKIFLLFKLENLKPLESFIFSISLGLGIIILFVFLIGIIGLLYKSIIFISAIPIVIYGLFQIYNKKKVSVTDNKKVKKQKVDQKPKTIPKFYFLQKLWVFIVFIAALVILIGCLSPEIFFDSLVYHLGGPNHWILDHKIGPNLIKTNHFFYSGYLRILFAIGLIFKDETVTKLIHFCFNILTCLTIFAMSERFIGKNLGILSCAIFFLIPYVGIVSYRSAMEMELSFFETLTIFSFIMWLVESKYNWLILSGINCGLAVGSKYTSFYCFIGILINILIKTFSSEKKVKFILKNLLIFSIPCFLIVLPWLLHNFIYTGNPLYPCFNKILGNINTRWNATENIYTGWNLLTILKAPWTISMGMYEESFLGPTILLILPIFLFFKQKWSVIRYLFIYIIIYWFLWANNHRMFLRYFIPALPKSLILK